MGLFSSKKKTKVGTSVARVIEDDFLPDSVKSGAFSSLFENGDSTDYILDEMMGSIGLRAERMYKYAKNHYTYGLPSGSVVSATQGTAQVQAVLDALEGTPVVLEYSRFGPPNNFHLAWMTLLASHGFDPATNQLGLLTSQKGQPVYLKNMVLVFPPAVHEQMEAAALEQWGTTATAGYTPWQPAQTGTLGSLRTADSVVVDPAATEEYALVTAIWEVPQNPAVVGTEEGLFPTLQTRYETEDFTIPLTGLDDDADYFHAKYVVNGITKYWLYEVGTGTYPTLDAVFDDPPDIAGTFFPFVYFRFAKTSMADLEGTPAYTTSKKLTKYLNLDYADMIASIHENPDIGDVEQAMLTMAVPAMTTHPLELRYLYEFFGEQFYLQNPMSQSQLAARIQALFAGTGDTTRTATVIQDQRFKMTLANDGIYKKLVAGKLGKVGSYHGGLRTVEETRAYTDALTGEILPYQVTIPCHYYQRQVSDSMYEEVEVRGLRMTYHVYGRYNTVGDEADRILLIPLDRSITREYSIQDREALYARSLHYVFNSRVVTKVKWYQSGWFKAILIIAAVVLTFWFPPGGDALWAAIAAGTVTWQALAYAILIGVVQYIAVTAAVKLFVKLVGPELAMLLAVLAAMYGMYEAVDAGSLAGAPWGEALLKVATNLASGVSDAVQGLLSDVMQEADQFGLFVEEQNALLDTAQDLLKNTNPVSALIPMVIWGEAPDDFYNRTVHAGNIGTVGISAIHSYVDMSLRLPELSATLRPVGAPVAH